MKITKRLFFGIISSLLLAVGFAHAADRFDPMTQSLRSVQTKVMDDPAPPCTTPCDDGSDGDR